MTPPNFQTLLTDEVAEEWRGVLADVIWWFHGFAASCDEAARGNLPDIQQLRDMRDDLTRIREGRDLISAKPKVTF